MRLPRRAVLLGLLSSAALGSRAEAAGPPSAIRIGALRFGTLSWELEVIRRHGFDRARGIAIESVDFAAAQATQVALQGGRVDMVALDWLWVSRQRAAGADWTFVPFSNAAGALVAAPGSELTDLRQLPGKRLGIAGSPLDKSWLILEAYARRQLGIDLDRATEKTFGAPPLLHEELKSRRLDAALTYWPFVAKAEAAGMRAILTVEDAVRGLGIAGEVPVVGYVFSEGWAERNRPLVDGFLAASALAREQLKGSDEEWQALLPLTGAADQAELDQLKRWYRRGIPGPLSPAEIAAAAKLFQVLAEIGGPALVGPSGELAPGTFWSAAAL